MTIASQHKTRAVKGRSAHALEIAERAIRISGLYSRLSASFETCVMNLAKVLMMTQPKSEHGRLLMLALSPANGRERSYEEQSVRWLIRRGDSPTAEAVAGRVAAMREHAAYEASRWEEANSIADRDDFRAAQAIADRMERTGIAPTWLELARMLGWPEYRPVMTKIFVRLERDGWIVTGREKNSLRPGARYFEQIGEAAS